MKNTITLIAALLISISSFAQQGINYKALIKDNLGNVLVNQSVGVQFQIREATANGSAVYTETHPATTDANGILVLNIGKGTTGDTFSAIDWISNEHWLNVQLDITGGTNYKDMSTTQFMAVPYALSAANAANKIDDLSDAKSDTGGSSLFIGVDAGINDDGSNNNNLGIGKSALSLNTTGNTNTAIGGLALRKNTTGNNNTAIGYSAMQDNVSGTRNTAIGFDALGINKSGHDNTAIGNYALLGNSIGNFNTATGSGALFANTGNDNSAYGYEVLYSNKGNSNTGVGSKALHSNNLGSSNTAVGYAVLYDNENGHSNTAIGFEALNSNYNGTRNTASGYQSLSNNISGEFNTASGFLSLENNTSGDYNTAIGSYALNDNTTGKYNTANGTLALFNNTTGNGNVASSYSALYNNTTGYNNVGIGLETLFLNTSGNNNTAIGYGALTNITVGRNNLGLGFNAEVPSSTGSNQVRVGDTNITYAGIQVDWSITSDKHWKENIRQLPYGLNMVMQLKPVDYTRKNNENRTREMGFIAQDLEVLLAKVDYKDQGFLTKDDDGYLSVRYNDFIALLTKALQEQQTIIHAQNSKIDMFESEMASLSKRLENLEAVNN